MRSMGTYLLLLTGVAVLSAGLAGLVVAESGLLPGLGGPISGGARIAFGTQGIILFLVGTFAVVRSGQRSPWGSRQKPTLYTSYGANTARAGEAFQDFRVTPNNNNPVQFMWCDASAGSRICPRLDHNGQFLRVEFLNAHEAAPSSIAVRGMDSAPLLNSPCRDFLQFQARVPTCLPKFTRPMSHNFRTDEAVPVGAPQRTRSVALTLRLVNGAVQHWVWQGREPMGGKLVVEGQSWKTFKVPLRQGWAQYKSDGNPEGPSKPDFSVISGVTFEIDDNGPPSPHGSYGLIDIRDIRLTD